MTTPKQKRTPKFSGNEENILVNLIDKYKAIIECKETDSVNNL